MNSVVEMALTYTVVIIILIAIALLPWLIFFVLTTRLKDEYIKLFLFGGVGWFLALIARIPIIAGSYYLGDFFVYLVSAVSAGIFEETFRFFFVKRYIERPITNGKVFSFGVGWGIMEVLLLHTMNLIAILMVIKMGAKIPGLEEFPEPERFLLIGLVGSYERLVAVALHIVLTIYIVGALANRKWMYFAIVMHSVVDLIAVLYYMVGLEILIIEVLITVLMVILYVLAKTIFSLNVKEFFFMPQIEFGG